MMAISVKFWVIFPSVKSRPMSSLSWKHRENAYIWELLIADILGIEHPGMKIERNVYAIMFGMVVSKWVEGKGIFKV